MSDWPIVVTNRCADNCAREFGSEGGREQARGWLVALIRDRGVVTDRLPAAVAGRRSSSGYFLLVDGVLILPLAIDSDGREQWIATDCVLFSEYRRRHGVAGDVDPFILTGVALLNHVYMSAHAVKRFQERCQGSPDPMVAEAELFTWLAPDVRAVQKPPAWCRTAGKDFYLVANDEFCLPVSRQGRAGRAFEAVTCMHRASDLFKLKGPLLEGRCLIDPSVFAADDERRAVISQAFARGRRTVVAPAGVGQVLSTGAILGGVL